MSKDCSHEATKYLWASIVLSADTPQQFTKVAEERISSNAQRALYVRRLSARIPEIFNAAQLEDWGADAVSTMLNALCRALSCVKNVETLDIQCDGFFVAAATILSNWAWGLDGQSQLEENGALVPDNNTNVPMLVNRRRHTAQAPNRLGRLKTLVTNLYAADGLGGFLAAQDGVESLTLHWRRDRAFDEPGSLLYPFPSSPATSTPLESANALGSSGVDAGSTTGANLHHVGAEVDLERELITPPNPAGSDPPTPATVLGPVLPHLKHVNAFARGLSELTRGRPINDIATPIREIGDIEALIEAMTVCDAPVTHLKVVVNTAELLWPLIEQLSRMRYSPQSAKTTTTSSTFFSSLPHSANPGASGQELPPSTSTSTSSANLPFNCPVESLSITLHERPDNDPSTHTHWQDTLANLRGSGFSHLHTIRWGGVVVPDAVREPQLYAGPSLRVVLLGSLGIPSVKIIRLLGDEEGRGGRWVKSEAPIPKADGSRRRAVLARIGAPDVYPEL